MHRTDSIYDDVPSERYQFPKIYLSRAEQCVGDWIIIVPSFDQAAFEIHRQNMWDKGYRLEARIQAHQFFESNGKKLNTMFDGAIMYAATFVRV